MKKVVAVLENNIGYHELNDSHIIGIQYTDGERSYVAKVDYGHYISVRLGDNQHCAYLEYESIQEILKENYVREAFVFDSREELVNWLCGEFNEPDF